MIGSEDGTENREKQYIGVELAILKAEKSSKMMASFP